MNRHDMVAKPAIDMLVPEHVRHFEAYVPSKPDDVLMKMTGCKRLFRLNNNENPLGPPPAARRVIETFPPPRAAIYPSGDAFHLRRRLAEVFGLEAGDVVILLGAPESLALAETRLLQG